MEALFNIGENIRKTRKAHGLSQVELAERVGVAPITIRQYESGKREPKLETISKIAKALGVSLVTIIPNVLETEDAHQLLLHQLNDVAQQYLYEALEDLREQLGEQAEKAQEESGQQPSFQTLSVWALNLVPDIAKAHHIPPELLRKYMWPGINDLMKRSEEDEIYTQVLDLLQEMTLDGKRAALRHLEELAQIPAYQAQPPAGEGEEQPVERQ